MQDYLKSIYKAFLEKYADLYLYYIKGIEDGPRIEKRMLKYQKAFEKWCKRRGIALVAFKGPNGEMSLSFVKEETWDIQHEKIQNDIIDEMMKEKGDVIKPKKELTLEEEVEKILNE